MIPTAGNQGFSRPPGRPLGIPAKMAVRQRQALDKAANREQWEMLEAAQRLLNDKVPVIDKYGNERAAFKYRVAQCQRGLHGVPPAIYGNRAGDRAEWRAVQTCGNVWHCLACARKVSSRRRDELNAMLSAHIVPDETGVFLLTYTHSHEKNAQPLAAQLATLQRAYRSFAGSKAVRAVFAEAGGVGTVTAKEVTHGEFHGWHTHYHVLVFVRADALPVLKRLRRLWVEKLIAVGLSGLRPGDTGPVRFARLRNLMCHALDIRDGHKAAEYVAKFGLEPSTAKGGRWGIGSEMTKGHTKRGERLQGRTPFALLLMYARGTLYAGDLFREYALAFSGKRQLVASKDLRARLIDAAQKNPHLDLLQRARVLAVLRKEKTDDEIAAAPAARCDVKIVNLSFADWRFVLMHQARGEVLEVAIEAGAAGVRRYLDDLRSRPPPPFAELRAAYEDDGAFLLPLRRVA